MEQRLVAALQRKSVSSISVVNAKEFSVAAYFKMKHGIGIWNHISIFVYHLYGHIVEIVSICRDLLAIWCKPYGNRLAGGYARSIFPISLNASTV